MASTKTKVPIYDGHTFCFFWGVFLFRFCFVFVLFFFVFDRRQKPTPMHNKIGDSPTTKAELMAMMDILGGKAKNSSYAQPYKM